MKNYRIIPDSFSGYEAQVKYAFFPFKWFQINDYKGVNTFSTEAEAREFISMKKDKAAGNFKAAKNPAAVEYNLEFKFFLKTGISSTRNSVWQERFMDYLLKKVESRSVAAMIRLDEA